MASEDEIAISVVTVASGDDGGDDEGGFQCMLIAKQVAIVDTSPDRPCLLRKNALGGNDFFRGDGEDFAAIVFVCCGRCGCCASWWRRIRSMLVCTCSLCFFSCTNDEVSLAAFIRVSQICKFVSCEFVSL